MFVVRLTEDDEKGGPALLFSSGAALPHGSGSRRPRGRLYSQVDTLLILAVFSVQGCRFCSANRELFCRHSGSGVTGWLMVFWKASCCSCMRILLACCRSASRSSAVCRLQRQETAAVSARREVERATTSVLVLEHNPSANTLDCVLNKNCNRLNIAFICVP